MRRLLGARIGALVISLLVALAVLSIGPRAQAQDLAIAPGHEADVLALFQPYANGGVVTGDVRIVGVEIGSDTVTVLLRDPSGASGSLVMRAHGAAGNTPSLGTSASFDLDPQPAPPPAHLVPALDALAARVRANDHGVVTRLSQRPSGETVVRASPTPNAGPRVRFAAIAWMALVALLLVVMRGQWKQRRPSRGALLVVGLVAVASVCARLATPATALHSNQHAVEDLRSLVGDEGAAETFARRVTSYGPSFVLPQRAVARAFGRTDLAVFFTSTLWGAIASVLVCAAAMRLTGSTMAGALAGLLHAALPVAVRVAHSESELVVAQCLVALVLWLAALAVDTAARAELAALGVALLLLATGHAAAPVFAGAVLVFCAGWILRESGPRARFVAVAGLSLAPIAGLAMVLSASRQAVAERVGGATTRLPLVIDPTNGSLWFDAWWTPRALWLLTVLGVAALVRMDRREGRLPVPTVLAISIGMLSLLEAGQMVRASIADGLRYQSLLGPAWALLAGAAWTLVGPDANGLRFRWARGAIGSVFAGTLVMLAARRGPWRWRDIEAEGYALVADAVAAMPDDAVVIVPETERGPEGRARVVFDVPEFAARRAGRRVRRLTLQDAVHRRDAGVLSAARTFAWRGPFCQAFEAQDHARVRWNSNMIRPECAEMLRAFSWTPVFERTLHTPGRNGGTLPATFDPYEGGGIEVAVLRIQAGAP